MGNQRNPTHFLAILLVVIVSTITQYEATRILLLDDGIVWKRNANVVLLSSPLWRPVSPPTPDRATNPKIRPSMIGHKNFVSQKTVAPPSRKVEGSMKLEVGVTINGT
ncbi:hypothetical protein HAX54_008298 [Datura stramonium]|uniref:Uncharacterized protein n=1 Tax=Datura stramonium TaxID=4076 RepID=A0ABS8RVI0_DATST|nr:hypothetical protein [Datura stramonium]